MCNSTNQITRIVIQIISSCKKTLFLFTFLFTGGLNSIRAQDNWAQKADFGGTARTGGVGFSIGSKGYFGLGSDANYPDPIDFWEYDPAVNTWTQKADFGGGERYYAVGFSIGKKGYVGTGHYIIDYNDFWEYDPDLNIWAKKANFMGGPRHGTVGFSIGNKGYLGTGNDYIVYYKDFWEYDPDLNIWKLKADFGGTARYQAVGFSIGSKGYIGMGASNYPVYYQDFWEYDPATNVWAKKADFAGGSRQGAVGFSIADKGYLGTGYCCGARQRDFWEYDPALNIWNRKADFGGTGRLYAVGFSIESKGYLGMGYEEAGGLKNDFWEYTPGNIPCPLATNLSVTNIMSITALLKWDAVAGAEAYRLRYKPLHSGNWVSKASSGVYEKVTGLLPATKYRWEVKTYCHKDPPQVTSDGSAKGEFTTAAVSVSNEDVQKVYFQIYPIPAKDILHIQTNGNASFSFVNQVGKILLTKNINGSGTINVAGIAAGLYYLKNNSTGAVQKVVIAR